MSVSFEELLDKNLNTVTMKPGSLLTGIVIDIIETHVICLLYTSPSPRD